MSKRAAFEETDEFCTCAIPHFEVVTKTHQVGSVLVDDILGRYCSNCNKPQPPKVEIDET